MLLTFSPPFAGNRQNYSTILPEKCKHRKPFRPTELENEHALLWFEEHPEYRVCRSVPAALYEEENGIPVRKEDWAALDEKYDKLFDAVYLVKQIGCPV